MRTRNAIALVVLAAALAVPAVAHAQTSSKLATRTYDLDFTLPTVGQSGCTVCHSDPNLQRPSGDTTETLFVDTNVLQESAHKDVPCTGCHVDFAYETPHQATKGNSEAWRDIAKISCKNCHENVYAEISKSSHSLAVRPGQEASLTAVVAQNQQQQDRVPLCGDCHGGHAIPSAEDTAAMAVLHGSGLEMCGGCHAEETSTYADYYHGKAYQRGALDAPACWQCHTPHSTLPTNDPESSVNPENLPETCGECHKDPGPVYVSYAELIHRSDEAYADNPVYSVFARARSAVVGAFSTVRDLIVGEQ